MMASLFFLAMVQTIKQLYCYLINNEVQRNNKSSIGTLWANRGSCNAFLYTVYASFRQVQNCIAAAARH